MLSTYSQSESKNDTVQSRKKRGVSRVNEDPAAKCLHSHQKGQKSHRGRSIGAVKEIYRGQEGLNSSLIACFLLSTLAHDIPKTFSNSHLLPKGCV